MEPRVVRADAEDWIRAHVEPVGPIETEHDRPWATVLRVPIAGGFGRNTITSRSRNSIVKKD
jgi:hypothetical protein